MSLEQQIKYELTDLGVIITDRGQAYLITAIAVICRGGSLALAYDTVAHQHQVKRWRGISFMTAAVKRAWNRNPDRLMELTTLTSAEQPPVLEEVLFLLGKKLCQPA